MATVYKVLGQSAPAATTATNDNRTEWEEQQ
jgi:hypothetical protein